MYLPKSFSGKGILIPEGLCRDSRVPLNALKTIAINRIKIILMNLF
jgi:hypothetical protein